MLGQRRDAIEALPETGLSVLGMSHRSDWFRGVLDEAASQLLTPRQQKILQMSAEGWSVQEIGGRLQMTPARVSDEKYKAVCKLREHFADEITPA